MALKAVGVLTALPGSVAKDQGRQNGSQGWWWANTWLQVPALYGRGCCRHTHSSGVQGQQQGPGPAAGAMGALVIGMYFCGCRVSPHAHAQ